MVRFLSFAHRHNSFLILSFHILSPPHPSIFSFLFSFSPSFSKTMPNNPTTQQPNNPTKQSACLHCLPWSCASNIVWWTSVCCSWKRYGTTSKHSQPYQRKYQTGWLHKDSCGLVTATLTQFLIFSASYIGTIHLLLPWHQRTNQPLSTIMYLLCMISFNTLLFLGAFSHYRAMTTDPGAVPEGALPLPSDFVRL